MDHIVVPEGQEDEFLKAIIPPITYDDDWCCPNCNGRNVVNIGVAGREVVFAVDRLWYSDTHGWCTEQHKIGDGPFTTRWFRYECLDCDWRSSDKSALCLKRTHE